MKKVLFICTGNSARSILAESILNKIGKKKFKALSAGSHPNGVVHPETLKFLMKKNYLIKNVISKLSISPLKKNTIEFLNWFSTYNLIPKGMALKLSLLSGNCLLYTSPSPRDATLSRMPSSA